MAGWLGLAIPSRPCGIIPPAGPWEKVLSARIAGRLVYLVFPIVHPVHQFSQLRQTDRHTDRHTVSQIFIEVQNRVRNASTIQLPARRSLHGDM